MLNQPLDRQLADAVRDPRLLKAGAALSANDLPLAERLLKAHLGERPMDVAAIRMLAEVAARLKRYTDSERLLARALELQPGFRAARLNYATVLQRGEKIEEATREVETLLREDPHDLQALAIGAAVWVRRGDFDRALLTYRTILDRSPEQTRLWLSYGHVLKTVGRSTEAISAYRQAANRLPTLGDAWWSLANLKTYRFSSEDMVAMRKALQDAGSVEDRFHLHFALGKSLEDASNPADAMANYLEGNRLRRTLDPYNPADIEKLVDHSIEKLDAKAFALRGGGHQADDPIFIVGLPRSGSTLVEQILSSHPEVEGTAELPHIPALVRQLATARSDEDPRYLDVLLRLSADERSMLGQQYLDRSRLQRKLGRRHFIDKLPNNWAHVGLIHLILPNAVIIDARRDAMSTCFSCFKQHFARGQSFTYDLADLGRYYSAYVRSMAHVDRVLPGRVHRLVHERLLDDPEREVRALLAACRLDFNLACLAFHKTERPVRTASAEQVRRPLNRDSVDAWRPYEQWLGPLAEALGRDC